MMTVNRHCSVCRKEGKTGIYRMVGGCYNCGTIPILGLFTVGHSAAGGDCPACGCSRLHWDQLATPEALRIAGETP